MGKRKSKAHQICSRTVEVVREETRPVVNFCIAAAQMPAEVMERRKQQKKNEVDG